jgi:hypothetical protein
MMIVSWLFQENGTQVAFNSNTVHGDLAPHYELRDVETGRLIEKWEGHLTDSAPEWTGLLK